MNIDDIRDALSGEPLCSGDYKHDRLVTLCWSLADQCLRLEGRVEQLEAQQRRPDPLDEALNSGDGVYRP